MSDVQRIPSPFLLEERVDQKIERSDVDFQLRMHSLGVELPSDGGHVRDSLLILTRSDDMEVSELSLELARRDCRLVRINRDDECGRVARAVEISGVIASEFERLRPSVVWTRHFKAPVSPKGDDYVLRKYAHDQLAAMPTIFKELGGRVINGGTRIESRIAQVRAAQLAGFRTPRSVMTHDLKLAVSSLDLVEDPEGYLIVKPLGSHWAEIDEGTMRGTFPRRIRISDALERGGEPTPVIVQEYVNHDYEVRTFIVGDELISYKIHGKVGAHSLWTSPESVIVEPFNLPPGIADSISSFAANNRIDLAAVEFMVTAEGIFVFLEVNFLFDWRYFQAKAGDSRVTEAIVNFLVGGLQK